MSQYLEYVWDNLLSRDPKRIRSVFVTLDEASQATVIEHLKKMVSEDGWHVEQVISAQAALTALNEYLKPPKK